MAERETVIPVEQAAAALRRGALVAFPTETVYGLGADATNVAAVRAIFAAKGRPVTNPLIVHVADASIARRYVTEWPEAAEKLAGRFWPGPLTLVLPKTMAIVDEVTAGLPSVALRVPDHPVALEMLRAFAGPVAAPSANKSSHVSPTTAQHVRDELDDAVDVILDGGPCRVGIESTVLDLSTPRPRLLRPGHITRAQIEELIGPVEFAAGAITPIAEPSSSPGQHERHYAPRTPAFRFDASQRARIDATNAAMIDLTLDPQTYARNFYARLRMLDAQNLRAIYIELPPDTPEWTAVRDRIFRATRPLG